MRTASEDERGRVGCDNERDRETDGGVGREEEEKAGKGLIGGD